MKRYLAFITALVCLFSLCSCKKSADGSGSSYKLPEKISSLKSGKAAENDKFILSWDEEVGNIILVEKATQKCFSSIPYDYYSGKKSTNDYADSCFRSSVIISYVNSEDNSFSELYSYEAAFANNTVHSVKIKNGIRLIYFFNDAEIAVPVDYTLTGSGLQAEVLVDQISENSKYRIYTVSVLPYLVSAENNGESYLFVPSGSGALMYTDVGVRGIRKYEEPIYGADLTESGVRGVSESRNVLLPVFGAKNGNSAMLGIVESGAETAYICAQAGDKDLGYSSVYCKFKLRGSDSAQIKDVGNLTQIVEKTSDARVKLKKAAIRYNVLSENSDYNGMAKAYREYLTDKKLLGGNADEKAVFIQMLGGAKAKRSFLGIPYDTVVPATTVTQAEDIVNDLGTVLENDFIVNLKGFGNGGLDYSAVGGGFTVNSNIGTVKQLKNLSEWCAKSDINLSMDFDLLRFNDSGSGFSKSKCAARSANDIAAKVYSFNLITHSKDEAAEVCYLLSPLYFSKAADKLLKYLPKTGLKSVSLQTAGSIAYGDYSNRDYYVKNVFAENAGQMIKKIKNQKYKIVTEAANVYAAVLSDYIFAAPLSSSRYTSLDIDIPFYQAVFKGSVPLSGEPINLAENASREFLKAVSTGSALEFTVIGSFDERFVNSKHSALAGSVYDGVKTQIDELYKKYSPLFTAVKGETIESYKTNGEITETLFSNGVRVYCNFGDTDVNTDLGVLKPNGFIYG